MRLVIDCNNICYMAAYSIKGLSYREMKTGVIFGFLKKIFFLSKELKTNKFVFCWDSKRSYRKLIYSRYKSGRKKDLLPEEKKELEIIYYQFDLLKKEILHDLGFKNVFSQTGYEADDLIAWIVQRFPDEYIIVSTDQDLWQLISKTKKGHSVSIYNPKTNKMLDYDLFCSSWGIEPKQWIEVKSIAGCKSDNINGINGVGELTAVKYLTGVLSKGSKKSSIDNNVELINRNRELVSLPFNGFRKININTLQEDKLYSLDFKDVFNKFGFYSFLMNGTFEKIVKQMKLIHGR